MTNHDSDLSARIAVIRQEYLARLHNDGLRNLRELRQRFLATPGDDSLRSDILHAAHDMNGSGAVFGCDDVSQGGHRLEDAMRALIKNATEDPADRHGAIIALIDELDAICVAAARGLEPAGGGYTS